MPNWCENYVVIVGPEKDIERLLQQAKKPFVRESGDTKWNEKTKKSRLVFSKKKVEPKTLSFHNFIPMPNEVAKTPSGGFQEPIQSRIRAMEEKNRKKHGSPNWYDWACFNWGTKWDVSHDDIEVHRSKGRVEMEFSTAWSPPDPVFEEMARQFPTLSISNEWNEEGGASGSGVWGPNGRNVPTKAETDLRKVIGQLRSDESREAIRKMFKSTPAGAST